MWENILSQGPCESGYSQPGVEKFSLLADAIKGRKPQVLWCFWKVWMPLLDARQALLPLPATF
jgi:hypothetical protein